MKLDALAESLLETVSLNCLALKAEVEMADEKDARAQRVKRELTSALAGLMKARDSYFSMHKDLRLEKAKREVP